MGLFDENRQQQFIEEDQALKQARSAASATQRGRTLEVASPRGGNAREDPVTQAPARAEPDWPHVVLRLDQLVVDRLLATCDESGVAITDVVLDAFDRCWLQLNQIAPPPMWASPLPQRTRLWRGGVGTTRKVHLLLTPAQRQQLEAAADRTGAGSLTDLVERVLRHSFELAFVAADSFIWATFAFEQVARLVLMTSYPWIGAAAGPAHRRAAVPRTSADLALVPGHALDVRVPSPDSASLSTSLPPHPPADTPGAEPQPEATHACERGLASS